MANFKTKKKKEKSNVISIICIMMGILEFVSDRRGYYIVLKYVFYE